MEKAKQTYKLPEGWISTSIIEIVHFQKGKKPRNIETVRFNGSVPYLDIKAFEYKSIEKYADPESAIIVDESDIVMVWDGARSGWVSEGMKGALGSTLALLKPFIVSSKYLYYYLTSQFYFINSNTKGTGIPHVDPTVLWKLQMPLPPLQEQNRIVSKIESIFSELEQAEKNLQDAKQQLETYKESLLKKAFSGELSNKWRDDNLYELKKSKKKLPANWKYKKVASLSNFVGSGSTPKGGRNIYLEDGIPFIRSQNVLVNRLIEVDFVFISSEIHEKMKRTHTKPKDVLINITGASIGRCAYIHEGFSEGNVNQHVCIIRANHKMIDYKYLTFFLNSPEAQLRIKQINAGATREALTLSQIKAFEIPVCDMREQNVITQILESQFTLIDNLNDTISKSVEEVVSLRQSILKKAFDGKLVNQEPTDESVLKLMGLIKKKKIDFLKSQKEALSQKPKKTLHMDTIKTVWQILSISKIAIRTDKLWSESKHKDDIDAFYAEVKELIDSGKIIEEKRQGKVSYLKVK